MAQDDRRLDAGEILAEDVINSTRSFSMEIRHNLISKAIELFLKLVSSKQY